MNTFYQKSQVVTYKNGKRREQGLEYNKINENGKPLLIQRDEWINNKHKRFSWVNKSKLGRKTLKDRKDGNMNIYPYWGMPILKMGKKPTKSKKKNVRFSMKSSQK